MAAVNRVASAMDINLTSGTFDFRLNVNHLAAWTGDLIGGITAADWKSATPATKRLKREWSQSMLALVKIRGSTSAKTFTDDLRTVANSCGGVA
jgi:hypothetical protein